MTLSLHKRLSSQLFLSMSLLFATCSLHAQTDIDRQADFKTWLKTFQDKAAAQGIAPEILQQAFKNVSLNEGVLISDQKQPEFRQTFFTYFNRAVSPYRIKNGQKNYQKHRALLREVTAKYGVPGRYLVAFWGLETNYGNYTGNQPIIESLATLAYDPRRSDYFEKELLSALRLLQLGHFNLEQMQGSWAGAMGQCQFMPSNYINYAVDGDNDGRIDLWNSLADVMHSAGHFLSELGWHKEENWGREVTLPANFDYALANNQIEKSLPEWSQLGLTLADGRPLPKVDMPATLLLATNYKGPAFLVYANFTVIKRWNNANKYALAVGHLADRIIGRSPLSKQAPANDKPLLSTKVKRMQTLLNDLGYSAGKPDGIAGSKTRQALRAFQQEQNLPADGFASLSMLEALRRAKQAP